MLIGTILKYILLAIAIFFTFKNIVNAFRGYPIGVIAMWYMAISISTYLALEFQTNF